MNLLKVRKKNVLDFEPTRLLSAKGTESNTSIRTLIKTFFAWLLGPLHEEEIHATDFDDLTLFHWVRRTSHWDRVTTPLDGTVVEKLFLSGTDSGESETFCLARITEYQDGIPQPERKVIGNPKYLVIGALAQQYVRIRTVAEQLHSNTRPDGFSPIVSISPSLLKQLCGHPQFKRLRELWKHRGYKLRLVPQDGEHAVAVTLESRSPQKPGGQKILRREMLLRRVA